MINKQDELRNAQAEKNDKQETIGMEKEVAREAVKQLEEFVGVWAPEKVEMLLVVGGFKKATEIEFESEQWYDGGENKKVDEKETQAFEEMTEKLGLIFEKKTETTKSNRAYKEDDYQHVRNIERTTYLIAKTKDDIEKLKLAEKGEDDDLHGEVYGFPMTSITAFKNDETVQFSDIPLNVRGSEAYAFATFMLSKNSWRDEPTAAQQWSDFVKKISPEIHKEQMKIMKEVIENREEEELKENFEQHGFEKMEFKRLSQLPGWNKFGSFDFAEKFADLEVVVIDDDKKWREIYGSNDSKSSYHPKTIILKKEIFDRADISDENLSWLVHEMGHVDFYDGLGEGVGEYMQEYYAAGKYTDSEMEQKAFEKQFEFLKSIGKTKKECLDIMEKYLTESFEERQENEKQQEFEQIKKYIENVYTIENEEGKNYSTQFLKDRALFDDKSILDESYPKDDPRRYIKLNESEEESTYNQYLNNLGLSEEMLRNKKIIDIGAGPMEFAGHCMLNGISEEIYSLEPRLQDDTVESEAQRMHWGDEVYRKIREKVVVASMTHIPFEDESFDYAFSHAAIPGIDIRYDDAEKMRQVVENSFAEIIRVLKPGGEARLFALPEKDNPDKKLWRESIDEVLSKIEAEGLHHVFIEEIVSFEADEDTKGERVIIKKAF